MKYALYQVVDTRDNKPMLWLYDHVNHRVALFYAKTAPSRIKQRTVVAPEGITWEPEETMLKFADMTTSVYVDVWG